MTRAARSIVAIAATVVALLAGCASDKGTKFHRSSTEPKSSATAPVPTPTPSREVVSLHDLTSGWTADSDPHARAVFLPPCFVSALAADHAESSASHAFTFSQRAPYFRETVEYFGASGAQTVFAAAEQRLNRCHTLSFKVKKVKVTGSMSSTSFAALGDTSHAYTATLRIGPSPLKTYLCIVRQGAQLVALSYQQPGLSANLQAFQILSQAAVQKLAPS
jgi:hypothetical protein